jgi:hypothetical protein
MRNFSLTQSSIYDLVLLLHFYFNLCTPEKQPSPFTIWRGLQWMSALQFEGTRYIDAVQFFSFLGNMHIFYPSTYFLSWMHSSLMSMQRGMHKCRQVQTQVVQQLEYLTNSLGTNPTSNDHRQAALQIKKGSRIWEKIMNNPKAIRETTSDTHQK